mmetsp:Transcript_86034/g.179911  ORF Transcript_86034/g.179911 Transcript_86034/m.179911 type:complete len:426 (+) Transcript_86034:185-1462(+)
MGAFEFGMSPLFTWESVASAFFGGLLLGCSVVFKTSCLGGVLGLSTYIKQLFWFEKKRYFFIVGMVIGTLALGLCWKQVEKLPPPGVEGKDRYLLFLRMIAGNYLLGLGSSLQCGCTSGHGLTGLARLSLQSWFAVPIFMLAGLLAGTLFQTADAFPPQHLDAHLKWFEGPLIAATMSMLLLLIVPIFFFVGRVAGEQVKHIALLLGETIAGVAFAAGLIISSMAFPSKVASFLDIASAAWDLCLPFVMAGGLCITFPYFLAVEVFKVQTKSLLLRADLDLPPRNRWPTWTLTRGAIYFGIGWGICATTPCSIFINLAGAPSWEMFCGLVAFVAGLFSTDCLELWRARLSAKSNDVSNDIKIETKNPKLKGEGRGFKEEEQSTDISSSQSSEEPRPLRPLVWVSDNMAPVFREDAVHHGDSVAAV